MKLNVFISKSGYCSRRKAAEFVKKSKVTVNGKTIDKPFYEVTADAKVFIDGTALTIKKHSYIIFNKPNGVLSSCFDKFGAKTILGLLPKTYRSLFPVGRLDKDSRGLLILTNDGDLCYKLTHPKFEIEKEYELLLSGKLTAEKCRQANSGIIADGDLLKVNKINSIKIADNKTLCRAVISEGKNRHLRRLFYALGYLVFDLKRVRIGNLNLGSLKEGQYKIFTKKMIYQLLFARQRLK
jgi:23S rRNA pseudouridine2605 synthase